MQVRGHRRCRACDNRWSYFETGTVACPACGSFRSVAVSDQSLHTDTAVEFDLGRARSMIGDRPVREVASEAQSAAREYLRERGFIRDGNLLPLDGTVVAAGELRHVGDTLRRGLAIDDEIESYFLDLLANADAGERPQSVPSALIAARGLAAVDVVSAYRRDLTRWIDPEQRAEVRPVIERLRTHEKRVSALDGNVAPSEADALVTAAQALGAYLRTGEESALGTARDRLAGLG